MVIYVKTKTKMSDNGAVILKITYDVD